MSALILGGMPIVSRLRVGIEASIADLVARGGSPPSLTSLLVGHNPPAEAYRAAIERGFQRLGIVHRARALPARTSRNELVAELRQLNGARDVTGVLVLMPLPPHLHADLILENLSPLKDVDGITPTNAGRLHLGLPSLRPSTPKADLKCSTTTTFASKERRPSSSAAATWSVGHSPRC